MQLCIKAIKTAFLIGLGQKFSNAKQTIMWTEFGIYSISPKAIRYGARPLCVQTGTKVPRSSNASGGVVRDTFGDLGRNQLPVCRNLLVSFQGTNILHQGFSCGPYIRLINGIK